MEVKIGVVYTAKELTVEIDGTADDVVSLVEKTIAGDESMLWLQDRRGRRIGIPTDKLAYVEFGDDEGRQVGFSHG